MAEGSGTATPTAPAGETPPPQTPAPGQPTPTTPPPATPPPASGSGGSGEGKESAAEKRIRELNEAKKAAEARAQQAEDALKAKEREEMSATERVQAEKEEAEKRAAAAEARATTLERGGWARAAANEAGFVDPEDAVQMLDLGSLDTETKVKNAVEKLKESKPHLIGTGSGAPAVPRPGFGNLGGTGQPGGEEVPVGADGEPDVKLGLGRDLLGTVFGRQR